MSKYCKIARKCLPSTPEALASHCTQVKASTLYFWHLLRYYYIHYVLSCRAYLFLCEINIYLKFVCVRIGDKSWLAKKGIAIHANFAASLANFEKDSMDNNFLVRKSRFGTYAASAPVCRVSASAPVCMCKLHKFSPRRYCIPVTFSALPIKVTHMSVVQFISSRTGVPKLPPMDQVWPATQLLLQA